MLKVGIRALYLLAGNIEFWIKLLASEWLLKARESLFLPIFFKLPLTIFWKLLCFKNLPKITGCKLTLSFGELMILLMWTTKGAASEGKYKRLTLSELGVTAALESDTVCEDGEEGILCGTDSVTLDSQEQSVP